MEKLMKELIDNLKEEIKEYMMTIIITFAIAIVLGLVALYTMRAAAYFDMAVLIIEFICVVTIMCCTIRNFNLSIDELTDLIETK